MAQEALQLLDLNTQKIKTSTQELREVLLDLPFELVVLPTSSSRRFRSKSDRYNRGSTKEDPRVRVATINVAEYGFSEPITDVIKTSLLKAYAILKIHRERNGEDIFAFNHAILDFVVTQDQKLIDNFTQQVGEVPLYLIDAMDAETSTSSQIESLGVDVDELLPQVRGALLRRRNQLDYSSNTKVYGHYNLERKVHKKKLKRERELTDEELQKLLDKDKEKYLKRYSQPFWTKFVGGEAIMPSDMEWINVAGLEFYVYFNKGIPVERIHAAYKAENILKVGPRVDLASLTKEQPDLISIILYRNEGDPDSALRVLPRSRYSMVSKVVTEGTFPHQLEKDMLIPGEGDLKVTRRRLNI